MHLQRNLKKLLSFSKKYYIILSVACILFIVGTIAINRLFIKNATYVYIKVKVGQNIWLSSTTTKSSIWYANAMRVGDTSYDFMGNTETKIIDKKVYLWSDADLYDIYLTMKVKALKNDKTNAYTFNREVLSVGSPIEIQFPKENITGIVTAVSEKMFQENLIEKTIYLTKRYAYPWEYEAITVGNSLVQNNKNIFTVLDKSMEETVNLSIDESGSTVSENRGYITVKAKVAVKKSNNTYFFGEEKIVEPGRLFDLSLGSFVLRGFLVSKIE